MKKTTTALFASTGIFAFACSPAPKPELPSNAEISASLNESADVQTLMDELASRGCSVSINAEGLKVQDLGADLKLGLVSISQQCDNTGSVVMAAVDYDGTLQFVTGSFVDSDTHKYAGLTVTATGLEQDSMNNWAFFTVPDLVFGEIIARSEDSHGQAVAMELLRDRLEEKLSKARAELPENARAVGDGCEACVTAKINDSVALSDVCNSTRLYEYYNALSAETATSDLAADLFDAIQTATEPVALWIYGGQEIQCTLEAIWIDECTTENGGGMIDTDPSNTIDRSCVDQAFDSCDQNSGEGFCRSVGCTTTGNCGWWWAVDEDGDNVAESYFYQQLVESAGSTANLDDEIAYFNSLGRYLMDCQWQAMSDLEVTVGGTQIVITVNKQVENPAAQVCCIPGTHDASDENSDCGSTL